VYHFRKTKKKYSKLNAGDKKVSICTLCNENNKPNVIKDNDTMLVLRNRVSYDIFEGRRVTDHLMIVPKRHVEKVGEFTDKEKLDFMSLAGEYEAQGYNVYARGMGNISRSVKHQHTHLIKTTSQKTKAVLYIAKPHILIHK
jgi:diadenosine tetraphosphate (Ap4A) HIT family hydrolase